MPLCTKGQLWSGFGLELGVLKEGKDLWNKMKNKDKYGGKEAIINDGLTDMKNNLQGLEFSRLHRNSDCAIWARHGIFQE